MFNYLDVTRMTLDNANFMPKDRHYNISRTHYTVLS